MSDFADKRRQMFEGRNKRLKDAGVFDYDYGPLGDKLKPGAELHDRLVMYAIEIADRGYSAIRECHPQWQRADWKATGFVPADEADPRQEKKDRLRTVIIPLSFRMEEMFLGAANGVFNTDPVFRWKPLPGVDSLIHAAVMEYMVQRHVLWFDFWLHADTVLRNAFRYGVGIAGLKWSTARAWRPVDREISDTVLEMAKRQGIKVPRKLRNRMLREMEEQILYDGSELQPWDPYTSFYDDSVSPNQFQKAAYKGTLWTCDATQLLEYERESGQYEDGTARWFNGWYARALAHNGGMQSQFNARQATGRDSHQSTTTAMGGSSTTHFNSVDVLFEIVKIIPSDWGIGDEAYPVDYMLAVAGDSILVGFGPLGLAHGMDGTAICAPNADSHTFMPVSHIATTVGIQDHIDTVARCTAASLEKNINGGWTIFNHNILDWDDFMNSDQVAKVIRPVVPALTPEMMQAGILNIPHQDLTHPHMQQVQSMIALSSELNGTSDIGGPGELAGSERPTKYGMMAQIQATSSRFRRLAYIIGAQFMTNIGWQMAYNLIQFGKQPQQVTLAGRFEDRIRRQLGFDPSAVSFMVDPTDLNINYEMEPFTGSMPQQDDLTAMSEIIKTGMAIPEVAAEMLNGVPWRQVFMAFLRKSGFDNIDDYGQAPTSEQVNVMPMPDDQLMAQQQAGNVVPIGPLRSGV